MCPGYIQALLYYNGKDREFSTRTLAFGTQNLQHPLKNEIYINFKQIHLPNLPKGAKVRLEINKGVFLYGF